VGFLCLLMADRWYGVGPSLDRIVWLRACISVGSGGPLPKWEGSEPPAALEQVRSIGRFREQAKKSAGAPSLVLVLRCGMPGVFSIESRDRRR